MTIGTLVLYIGLVAAILTAAIKFGLKKDAPIWMIFLQTFCGSLFLFSGWVKAVDPLGTAYKMEQYFTEFHYTFQDTAMSFIAPLFPFLSEYVVGFSVIMILVEIILGGALLLGAQRRLTAWVFLLLTIFFTILTGFTFLTGYVPSGENFFSFSQWGPYAESNMRVTDCGCFGDFIKLKPRVSFMKDVFLLVPAILFILFYDREYQLLTSKIRNWILSGLTVVTLVYCFSNYVWDIPHLDFRPFREGADIRAQYEAEQKAIRESNQVVAWKLKNTESGKVVEVPNNEYLSEISGKYNRDEWEVVQQVQGEPSIPITKISDLEFTDSEGNSKSQELLDREGTTILLVSYKLKGEYGQKEVMMPDTIWRNDTVMIESEDTFRLEQVVDTIVEKKAMKGYWTWEKDFKNAYTKVVNPFIRQAQDQGAEVMGVAGGAGAEALRQFEEDINATYLFYEADDILLKTIVRSNPGIVVWKDGRIIAKWHYKQLPEFSEVKEMF